MIPPNCNVYQSPNNTLTNMDRHVRENLGDSQLVRSVIFILDFQMDFQVPVSDVLEQMTEVVKYIKSQGHVITFSFLPFAPANSKDPNVKTAYFPSPNWSTYIVSLNT